MSLIVSSQNKDTRQTAKHQILKGLKELSDVGKNDALECLLLELSKSTDTCQQNYLIDILACQVEPDIDMRIIKIIESGNGNFEAYIKTYVYSIYKKHAPENKYALASL